MMSDFGDCLCSPRVAGPGAVHDLGCPEKIPTHQEEQWIRATRENPNAELWEFERPDFGLKKYQYIWEMMRHKKRVSQKAKDRALHNYEEAILRYAAHIEHRRWEAQQMAEYGQDLM